MTWRIWLDKLSFPLLVGVLLLWGALGWSARQKIAAQHAIAAQVQSAVQAQARVDAERMETAAHYTDVSDCQLADYAFDPDGRALVMTRLACKDGSEVVIRGALPRVAISRKGRVTLW